MALITFVSYITCILNPNSCSSHPTSFDCSGAAPSPLCLPATPDPPPFLAYQGGSSTTTISPWHPPSPSPAPSALPLLARAPRRRRHPWYAALSPLSSPHSPNPSLPPPLLAPLRSPLALPISCRIFFFQHKLRAATTAATKPTPTLGRRAPQRKSGELLGVGTLRFLAQGPKGGGSSVWRCELLCFLLLLVLAICPHSLLSLFAASIQFVIDPASVVPSSQEAPLLSLFAGRLLHPIHRRSGSCQEAPVRLPLSVLHCCWPCVLRRIPVKR
jgi:hypothetical protein